MIARVLGGLVFALGLAGCAVAPTRYQPDSDGTGYAQQQLDARTWRVQFAGNARTPRRTVENYLLYRSAEIMLFGGHDKFVFLDKEVERDLVHGGAAYPSVQFGAGIHHGHYGGYYYGPGYYGPGYYEPGAGASLVRYSATATIRVYSGGQPPKDAALYDAREIIRQLGPSIVMPEVRPG